MPASPLLRCSFQTRLDATGDGPKWNLLFPRGEWHGANLEPIGGSIVLDDALFADMVGNWKAAGRPPLPIRKTHLHLEPDVEPVDRLELEAAYGLLTDLRVTAEGLEALTEWNELGRADVKSGKYNFWSPEWAPSHTDRRTGEARGWWLQGTALTNDPFFHTMPRVAASHVVPPLKGKTMNPELLKRLKAALKMPEECSDEDLVASCEKAMAATVSASVATTEAITAAVSPLQASLTAARAEVEALKAEAAKATAAVLDRDVEALMLSAKGEGKAVEPLRTFIVSAAKRDGLDAAKALVAALPATVPLKETGVSGDEKSAPEALKAAVAEYGEKLSAFAKERNMSVASAAHLFHRAEPELAKRAFALTPGSTTTR